MLTNKRAQTQAFVDIGTVLEVDVEAHLFMGVKLKGGECLKFLTPGRVGAPDRMVLMPHNRIYFVELKKAGGELKTRQARYHKMLNALGFRVYVLWSIDEVNNFLELI